jgi:hypothetical protein
MAIHAPTRKLRGVLKHINPKLKFDRNPFDSSTIGKLKAEVAYVAGKNGRAKYLYTTDASGRVRTVTAAPLKLKPAGQPRVPHFRNPPDRVPGQDEAGHLIADLFQGSGGRENILAQLKDVNQKTFKDMESRWAGDIRGGKHVSVHLDVDYDPGSGRPTGFRITETIADPRTGEVRKRPLPYIPN